MDTGLTIEDLIKRISALFELRRHEEALTMIRDGLQRWPEEPLIFRMLGAYHELKDEDHKALKAYQEAIKLDPEFLDARERLCLMLHDTGNTKKAKEHLDVCLEQGSSVASVHALAYLVNANDHPFKAERFLKQALKLDPEDELVRYAESHNTITSLKLGKFKKLLTQQMEKDPTSAGAMFGMGLVELSRRKFKNAENLLRQSYVLEPDEGKLDAWIDARIGKYFPFVLSVPLGWISYPFSMGFQVIGFIFYLILLLAIPMSQYESHYDQWLWMIYMAITVFLSLTYILKYTVQYVFRSKHHPEVPKFSHRDAMKLTLLLATVSLWFILLEKDYNLLMANVFVLMYVMMWPLVRERSHPLTKSGFMLIYGLAWLSFLAEVIKVVFSLDIPNFVSLPSTLGWVALLFLIQFAEKFENT
ncbi:MAG: hypothetical protein AAF502_09745 [Bacteroidota bacterium]